MDLTSTVGLILGVGAIIVGNILEGSGIGAILQPTAALIVFGGTAGAVILSACKSTLGRIVPCVKEAFQHSSHSISQVITDMVALAYKARREGIIALEEDAQKATDPLLQKALTLLSDGADSKHLRETMEIEMSNLENEMEGGAKLFDTAGGIAPTVGILGAVLGLIHVMQNLTDPSKLGEGIAVAFVATVYGVGIANLVLIPLGNKIKAKAKQKMHYYETILEGVMAVQNGDNPRMIEEKLKGFLGTQERATYVPADKKAKPAAAARKVA